MSSLLEDHKGTLKYHENGWFKIIKLRISRLSIYCILTSIFVADLKNRLFNGYQFKEFYLWTKHEADRLTKSRLGHTGLFLLDIMTILKASFKVSRKITVAKEPHHISEELILLCCKDIIWNVIGSSELQKLNHASLSIETLSKWLVELSDNILLQVVSKIHNLHFNLFAIHLDETMDAVNLAQLCVYVCYEHNNHLEEEFLFCETLSTKTTIGDIFK